jgi:spore germination protein YaaH
MIRRLLIWVICLALGAAAGLGFIRYGGLIPVRFDSPALASLHVAKPQIVGFLPYWLLSKADKNYVPYITTLTYFGVALTGDGSVMKLTNPDETEPGWLALQGDNVSGRLTEAKKHGIKKSLLVISGDDQVILGLLDDPVASATRMMSDIAPIMKEKKFEDLNLDIETFMEASDSGREKFTLFVRTVKEILHAQKLGSLSIDLIPIALVKPKLYDASALGKIVDSVILMTYDYHYSGSYTSGAVAPIGGAGETLEFDVDVAVKEALRIIPKEKILLGIPLYGYQWETIEPASESATIAGGSETVSSRRIAEKLETCTDCVRGFDPIAREPYVIYPEGEVYKQAYYENEDAMKEKIKLAQKYNLGGVALWALGYDDATILRPLELYKNSLSLSW